MCHNVTWRLVSKFCLADAIVIKRWLGLSPMGGGDGVI